MYLFWPPIQRIIIILTRPLILSISFLNYIWLRNKDNSWNFLTWFLLQKYFTLQLPYKHISEAEIWICKITWDHFEKWNHNRKLLTFCSLPPHFEGNHLSFFNPIQPITVYFWYSILLITSNHMSSSLSSLSHLKLLKPYSNFEDSTFLHFEFIFVPLWPKFNQCYAQSFCFPSTFGEEIKMIQVYKYFHKVMPPPNAVLPPRFPSKPT